MQVDGKVTGSFQSGYLAEVAVNGFTYHAVLFSPYLALATPSSIYPEMVHNPKPPPQLPADGTAPLPEDSGVLDSSEMDAKAEDAVPEPLAAPAQVDFAVGTGTSESPV